MCLFFLNYAGENDEMKCAVKKNGFKNGLKILFSTTICARRPQFFLQFTTKQSTKNKNKKEIFFYSFLSKCRMFFFVVAPV
jgi:hypothetical protein